MSADTYETRTTRWVFGPAGHPQYSDLATEIRLEDEGGGQYVVACQPGRVSADGIAVIPAEWPALSDAISHAMSQCVTAERNPPRSPVPVPERLREIAQLYAHLGQRLDALAELVDVHSGGVIPEEHSTRARICRRVAGEYRELACAVERLREGNNER